MPWRTATSPCDPRSILRRDLTGDVTQRWRTRLAEPRPLTEAVGLGLLADYGVPVLAHHVASDVDAAYEAASDVGYPVVVKTAVADILHKSDVGGVVLNATDEPELRAAYADLKARLGPQVLITPMVIADVEMAFGVVSDPQFGPMVLVAGGGVFIECWVWFRSTSPSPRR